MTDKRAFAVFDVGYLDNPKIAPLLDEGPGNAILMHAASVMYCAQHLTDGYITERAMQRKIGASQWGQEAVQDKEEQGCGPPPPRPRQLHGPTGGVDHRLGHQR